MKWSSRSDRCAAKMNIMSTNQNNNEHLIKLQLSACCCLSLRKNCSCILQKKQLEPKQANRVAAQLLTEGREK